MNEVKSKNSIQIKMSVKNKNILCLLGRCKCDKNITWQRRNEMKNVDTNR